MKHVVNLIILTALSNGLCYGMESTEQTAPQATAQSESLSAQLNQLSLEQKQEVPLLISKEQVEAKKTEFIEYVKRTKKHIKNPGSAIVIGIASKFHGIKKRAKKDGAEYSKGFLGVKGAEPEDIHFLNQFLEKKNKEKREKSLKEFGQPEDILRIHEILKATQSLNPYQIEEQRIALLHKQVVIYLNEKEGTTKKDLREKVKKNEIQEDLYFKATAMSLYGAFVLEDKIPKDK